MLKSVWDRITACPESAVASGDCRRVVQQTLNLLILVRVLVPQHMKLGKYQHSKTGNYYRVIGVAKNSETLEEFVVYEALYENPTSKLWIRPIKMFSEKVDINCKKLPRFKFVGE